MRRHLWLGALAASLMTALWPLAALAAEPQDFFSHALRAYGWYAALPAAFLGGISTAATPCVYPMVAITVSVFGAKAASRGRAAVLSTAFVHGIAALFVPLGLLAGLSGAVAGAVAGEPVVLALEAALMFAMAASMFGAFEIALPASIQGRLASIGGHGIKGAFLIGLALGPIAAPCATAPLSGILDYVFRSQNAPFGAAALYLYSLGLGLPFWIAGTFALTLPKSGRWMNHVKSVLGLVLIVTGLYYLRRLVPFFGSPPRSIPSTPWFYGMLVIVGLALGAVHLPFKDGPRFSAVRKTFGTMFAALGTVWLLSYDAAMHGSAMNASTCAPISWQHDLPAARTTAARESRPMLLDFGATWCSSCEKLAHVTFRAPEVTCTMHERRYVAVKLYDDVDPPLNFGEIRNQYSVRAMPTVIILDARGHEVARETEFVPADRMVALLRRVDDRRSEGYGTPRPSP